MSVTANLRVGAQELILRFVRADYAKCKRGSADTNNGGGKYSERL